MSPNLTIAFLVTLVGMGLVFGAIVVLWISMAALVDLTQKWDERSRTYKANVESPPTVEDTSSTIKDYRKIAAAIGAAYAIAASRESTVHEFPLPSTAFVSAWQAVMRSKNFSTRRQSR